MSEHRIILGFDFGNARTGVAVGQEITRTASPLTTLHSRGKGPDWPEIETLIREWRPHLVIVGMPRIVDKSSEALRCRITRFCGELERRFAVPVETVDESYSSREAHRGLKEIRQRGGRRRVGKGDVDKVAAAILLERWMSGAGWRSS